MNRKIHSTFLSIALSLFFVLIFIVGNIAEAVNMPNKKEVPRQESFVDSFPVPANVDRLLFYIQRDPNTNTICYTLNLDENGKLNTSSPIHPFWIRYPEGGVRKELNFIQRKFAYGINTKKLGADEFDVRSVAYNKLPLQLKKDPKGQYHVYASINNQEAILERIFIRIGDGGTFWSPDVRYIELKGTEVRSGKKVLQRFKP